MLQRGGGEDNAWPANVLLQGVLDPQLPVPGRDALLPVLYEPTSSYGYNPAWLKPVGSSRTTAVDLPKEEVGKVADILIYPMASTPEPRP